MGGGGGVGLGLTGIIEGSLIAFGIFLSGMSLASIFSHGYLGFFFGFFFGGGRGERGRIGYSSILEKQMRKIYDQFGTMPSNETQTLKVSEIRHGIFWEFRWKPGVLRVIQQHYSQHKNHCYIYQLLI